MKQHCFKFQSAKKDNIFQQWGREEEEGSRSVGKECSSNTEQVKDMYS